MIDLYLSGAPAREIAEKYGVSLRSIKRLLQAYAVGEWHSVLMLLWPRSVVLTGATVFVTQHRCAGYFAVECPGEEGGYSLMPIRPRQHPQLRGYEH